MADTPDLSKIIGLIMENPDLIARIQGLAKGEASSTEEAKETAVISDGASTVEAPEANEGKAIPANSDYYGPKERRSKLLYAMKPYLSTERAKAIDSMLSVAEILDMMRSK